MPTQRYKISLNNARFPMVSRWAPRATLIPSLDTTGKHVNSFIGDEESADYNIPQILYGENFVPVANGVKSVSYVQKIAPTVNEDFDQIFPLRDSEENTVLFSPGKGKNYVYDDVAAAWSSDELAAKWAAEGTPLYLSTASEKTPATAAVTRAYVEGKTVVCYQRLGLTTVSGGSGITKEGSLYAWDEVNTALARLDPQDAIGDYRNLNIPIGQIDGVSSSNGYLLFWSGLEIHWAPFNGAAFDFEVYANGEVTGAGQAIPEDIQGPITAIVPMSGGYVIFTTKNAIAAFYNANNFASPWIFKSISGAGGVDSFEQVATEGGVGTAYGYTTGGLQRFSLNTAEPAFADVTDFLGGRFVEHFNTGDLHFEPGVTAIEFFTKVTLCGQRFLVISYGMMPGIYSYALVYDVALKRWGKLRLQHVDCFAYQYGMASGDVTYAMLLDVSYTETDPETYDSYEVQGGSLTYPRQSVAFLLKTGEVKLAVLDHRVPEDDSEAFIVIGRNQISRSRLATLHAAEIDGIAAGGQVAVLNSLDGKTQYSVANGVLREQTEDYAEYGFDLPTGKNFSLFVKGQFAISDVIIEASVDGKF